MADTTAAKIKVIGELTFSVLGIPPSTERIEQAKEQAVSEIKNYELFLKRTLIFSSVMLTLFVFSAYFSGLGLVAIGVVLLLMSFSALLAANGSSTSIIFLVLANAIAFLGFYNQHWGFSVVACAGLVCTLMPYFYLSALITKSDLAVYRLAEYSAVDEEKLQTIAAWSHNYPACRYYFEQVAKMQRPVTRAEYEAALDLVLELNKDFARRYSVPFNNVPFFF